MQAIHEYVTLHKVHGCTMRQSAALRALRTSTKHWKLDGTIAAMGTGSIKTHSVCFQPLQECQYSSWQVEDRSDLRSQSTLAHPGHKIYSTRGTSPKHALSRIMEVGILHRKGVHFTSSAQASTDSKDPSQPAGQTVASQHDSSAPKGEAVYHHKILHQ